MPMPFPSYPIDGASGAGINGGRRPTVVPALEARKLSAAALNQRPIAEIALAPNQNFVRVMRFPRLNFCDGGGRRLQLHVDRTTSDGG